MDGYGGWISGVGLAATVLVYGKYSIFNVYMLKIKNLF